MRRKVAIALCIVSLVVLVRVLGQSNRNAPKQVILPEYVCLDTVIQATTPEGATIFTSLQARRGECQSAVMPSPLSGEDRDLLYKMNIDASNVSALLDADEIRVAGGSKKTWTPLIDQGVKNFSQMRTQFCSKHPDMFVYQLKDDGERTAPNACSKE